MSNLVIEILLRLIKPLLALVLGGILYAVLTGPIGEPGSVALALLCCLSGAAFMLLIQESPL